MRAAKVIWSNNGWTLPQGTATHGVMVNGVQLMVCAATHVFAAKADMKFMIM